MHLPVIDAYEVILFGLGSDSAYLGGLLCFRLRRPESLDLTNVRVSKTAAVSAGAAHNRQGNDQVCVAGSEQTEEPGSEESSSSSFDRS